MRYRHHPWTAEDLLRLTCSIEDSEKQILIESLFLDKNHCVNKPFSHLDKQTRKKIFKELLKSDIELTSNDMFLVGAKLNKQQERGFFSRLFLNENKSLSRPFKNLTHLEKRQLLVELFVGDRMGKFADYLTNEDQINFLRKMFRTKGGFFYTESSVACAGMKAILTILAVWSLLMTVMGGLVYLLTPLVVYLPWLAPWVARLTALRTLLTKAGLALAIFTEFLRRVFMQVFDCQFDPEQVEQDAINAVKGKEPLPDIPEKWVDGFCDKPVDIRSLK